MNQQMMEERMENIVLEKIRDPLKIRNHIISYWKAKIPLTTGFFSEEELEIMLKDTRKLKEIIRKNIEPLPLGGEPEIHLEADLVLCIRIGGENCRWRWR